MVEHEMFRRIQTVISHKQIIDGESSSIIQRNLTEIEVRDTLLKISRLCQSFSLSDFIRDTTDF